MSALVDLLLTVLNLSLDATQFLKVLSVDVLEIFDPRDLQILLFADDNLTLFIVRDTCSIETFDSTTYWT